MPPITPIQDASLPQNDRELLLKVSNGLEKLVEQFEKFNYNQEKFEEHKFYPLEQRVKKLEDENSKKVGSEKSIQKILNVTFAFVGALAAIAGIIFGIYELVKH